MNNFIRNFQVDISKTSRFTEISKVKNVFKKKSNGQFNVLQINIRSLSKNFDQFTTLLHEMDMDVDRIVLTETRILYDINIFKLDGYNAVYSRGDFNQNDGVVIYLKNNYEFEYALDNIFKFRANIKIKLMPETIYKRKG